MLVVVEMQLNLVVAVRENSKSQASENSPSPKFTESEIHQVKNLPSPKFTKYQKIHQVKNISSINSAKSTSRANRISPSQKSAVFVK